MKQNNITLIAGMSKWHKLQTCTSKEKFIGSHGEPNRPKLNSRTKIKNLNYTNRFLGSPGTPSYL